MQSVKVCLLGITWAFKRECVYEGKLFRFKFSSLILFICLLQHFIKGSKANMIFFLAEQDANKLIRLFLKTKELCQVMQIIYTFAIKKEVYFLLFLKKTSFSIFFLHV